MQYYTYIYTLIMYTKATAKDLIFYIFQFFNSSIITQLYVTLFYYLCFETLL